MAYNKSADGSSMKRRPMRRRKKVCVFCGKDNVIDVTNCATRLRLTVKDAAKVADSTQFQEAGASGLVNPGNGGIQIIVGLTVPTVRESFEELMAE